MKNLRDRTRPLLSAFMVIMGILHFTHGELFASIVPKALPYPLLLVYISGVAEIALGVMLAIEKTRRLAGYGLIALFIAVFPANIYMALHPELTLNGKPDFLPNPSATAAWLRLPFQFVLIYWAYLYTKREETEPKA